MSRRVIELEGVRNFRDLGGYASADGHALLKGLIYRSGSLHSPTQDDRRRISELRVRLIIDFRGDDERASQPVDWQHDTSVRCWSCSYGDWSGIVEAALEDTLSTEDAVRQSMGRIYGKMPNFFADQIRAIFSAIDDNELPLVFHCSAGKDRTGIAAAILLAALGVPRRVILDDYALSEGLVNSQAVLDSHGSDRLAKSAGGF